MRTQTLVPSGIPAIGDIPLGSHFCNFYSTSEDLADSLVPYTRNGHSKPGEVLRGWVARKEQALAKGRKGLRLTGNTYWLDATNWKDFAEYEETVNRTFHQHEIVGLCSYCLHRCDSTGILDVVRNHQFAVARRHGQWEVVENSSLKIAKEELRRLNAELERRVVERTAALEAALQERARAEQEALDAVRARDEFLSMASHELKTPLTSLKLQLELVKAGVAGTEGELARKVAAKLQTIERQLLRLNALNGSLLDVTTLDQGRLHLEFQHVDLAALVRDALKRLEPDFARAGCEVRLAVEGEALGWWDPMRVDQIVVNLLSNAVKYGSGKPVQVTIQQRGEGVALQVKDQGIGISAEAQARLFRKFERAVPARHYGGLGLGLYISRTLAEAIGGTIQVDSQPGQGATFTVWLPHEPALH